MRIRVVATVALVIVAVLVIYVFLTVGFAEVLEVGGFREDDDGVLVAGLYDHGQNIVGGIHVQSIDPEGSLSTLVRVEIWRVQGTRLDSLSIAFESALQFEVFPAFDRSPSLEFRRSEEGRAVVFSAPDLGFEGRGDVILEFYVTPTLAQLLELDVRFEVTIMYEEGVVSFHRMEAEAVVTLTVKRE